MRVNLWRAAEKLGNAKILQRRFRIQEVFWIQKTWALKTLVEKLTWSSFFISSDLMISVPNKCASQYIFQMAFKLLGLPKELIESHKPGQPYSFRSAVRWVNNRKGTRIFIWNLLLDSDVSLFGRIKGQKLLKNCQTSLKVLVVRHPILRLASAWNDKFNVENKDGPGIRYGINLLLRTKSFKFFEKERQFVSIVDIIHAHKPRS